jgi:hypothetical protein
MHLPNLRGKQDLPSAGRQGSSRRRNDTRSIGRVSLGRPRLPRARGSLPLNARVGGRRHGGARGSERRARIGCPPQRAGICWPRPLSACHPTRHPPPMPVPMSWYLQRTVHITLPPSPSIINLVWCYYPCSRLLTEANTI